MKTATKIWLIIAACLTLLGLVLWVAVMADNNWDFTALNNEKYETNTYQPFGDFDKISINVAMTDIKFAPSDDKDCKIVCYESQKVKHSAAVQSGTLVIGTIDTRKWYEHIGIFIENPKMTVFLPQDNYTSLFIDTDTGDITLPQNFTFGDIEINGDTSDIECLATVLNLIKLHSDTGTIKLDSLSADEIDVNTNTGKVVVSDVAAKNNMDIKTDTGKIELANVTCTDLTAQSDTGSVFLKNVIASNSFFIESDTGKVVFEDSDAARISVRTSTGDVTGTLLSEKIFITQSFTGRVNVPPTTAGGKCEIKTSTGDIVINITP